MIDQKMQALVGNYLNKNIYNKSDVLLIPANTILKNTHITLLISQHISLGIEDVNSASSIQLMDEAIKETRVIFETIQLNNAIPLNDIKMKITPLIAQCCLNPDLFSLILILESKDQYTYKHSFAVAVISTLIGGWMGLTGAELDDLMISSFLHDIGKIQIPDTLLNKTVPLTKQEFQEIKKHPEYGYQLICRSEGVSERHALVALQHHEREDGSGYPAGLKGSEIGIDTKIVAVADVFHAMISKRSYKDAIPLFQVMRELMSGAYGLYDPKVIHCFISKIMTALIGSKVLLSDGDEAQVILVNIYDLLHPLVKKQEKFIDLSKKVGLEIVKHVG